MRRTYPIPRPVWAEVYKGIAHIPDRDQFLLSITRESLRLAAAVLRKQCEEDYYNNYGAALHEIEYSLQVEEPRAALAGETNVARQPLHNEETNVAD
jgi:hypothetical protein